MIEVRIAPLLAADAEKVEQAILLIDPQQLRHIPLAAGDLALEVAGRQIVEVEVPPVIALREPDYLIGGR